MDRIDDFNFMNGYGILETDTTKNKFLTFDVGREEFGIENYLRPGHYQYG